MDAAVPAGRKAGRRRRPVLLVVLLVVVLLGATGLCQLLNSRTFQVAGRLTDRMATGEKVAREMALLPYGSRPGA